MIVYKIENKINGKVYIGKTSETLKKRVGRHFGYQQRDMGIKDHSIISRRCRHIIKKPYKNKYVFRYFLKGQETIEKGSLAD